MAIQLLIPEIERRIIGEYIPKILHCIEILSPEQLYSTPNNNLNSIHNLIVHLDGNIRQWIFASLTNRKDKRQRELEFKPMVLLDKPKLIATLEKLSLELKMVLAEIQEDQLKTTYNVQCYQESGFSILIHGMEHFSYHTGQIVLLTKMFLDIDTNFYGDLDLNATNS